jgi:hypothetical protein
MQIRFFCDAGTFNAVAEVNELTNNWFYSRIFRHHEVFRKREVMAMQVAELCYCKSDIMSVCTAENESQQKYCRFYEKSSYSGKCMYLVFDEYCDCLAAQLNANQTEAIKLWEDALAM